MELYKETFPSTSTVHILNTQLLLLNSEEGAIFITNLIKLFNVVEFDTLFFKRLWTRFIKFNSFCIGGLDLMQSI